MVEYIVAIDVTRVRFPADATSVVDPLDVLGSWGKECGGGFGSGQRQRSPREAGCPGGG